MLSQLTVIPQGGSYAVVYQNARGRYTLASFASLTLAETFRARAERARLRAWRVVVGR